jgi:hypothetical protein
MVSCRTEVFSLLVNFFVIAVTISAGAAELHSKVLSEALAGHAPKMMQKIMLGRGSIFMRSVIHRQVPPLVSSPAVVRHQVYWFPSESSVHYKTGDLPSSDVLDKVRGRQGIYHFDSDGNPVLGTNFSAGPDHARLRYSYFGWRGIECQFIIKRHSEYITFTTILNFGYKIKDFDNQSDDITKSLIDDLMKSFALKNRNENILTEYLLDSLKYGKSELFEIFDNDFATKSTRLRTWCRFRET